MADIFELAHVAGPVVRREERLRGVGEALAIDAEIARALGEEVTREQPDVVAALP